MFWNRFVQLCIENDTSPTRVVKETGIAAGSVTKWKAGSRPNSTSAQKLAEYFGVSVEYLLGVTDDPIDYDSDGDALASIPLSYVEAAGGDMKKAMDIKRAVDEENLRPNAKASLYIPADTEMQDVIIYNRNGKTVRKRLPKAEYEAAIKMLDALGSDYPDV